MISEPLRDCLHWAKDQCVLGLPFGSCQSDSSLCGLYESRKRREDIARENGEREVGGD